MQIAVWVNATTMAGLLKDAKEGESIQKTASRKLREEYESEPQIISVGARGEGMSKCILTAKNIVEEKAAVEKEPQPTLRFDLRADK